MAKSGFQEFTLCDGDMNEIMIYVRDDGTLSSIYTYKRDLEVLAKTPYHYETETRYVEDQFLKVGRTKVSENSLFVYLLDKTRILKVLSRMQLVVVGELSENDILILQKLEVKYDVDFGARIF